MATKVVIGAQWGDEGKGKIIDILAGSMMLCGAFPGRKQCRSHS